jgi:hypothetical protein
MAGFFPCSLSDPLLVAGTGTSSRHYLYILVQIYQDDRITKLFYSCQEEICSSKLILFLT